MIEPILIDTNEYIPGLSIDCVIFGFHDNQLKVLAIKSAYHSKWSLPGGFIKKEEDLDTAAHNILFKRTGLKGIFLRQFAAFGHVTRSENNFTPQAFKELKISEKDQAWYLQRFVSIGYYALVNFRDIKFSKSKKSEAMEWIDPRASYEFIIDHKDILDKALETLQKELNLLPIGYKLLPEKFTIPELQKLYETILGRQLDRRNFLRKITHIGIIIKLDEKKTKVAHKAPNYFRFDKQKYEEVLKNGINQGW
ncbi:NUDIX domain-containing protein [Flavobacterium branchiophilum]|uniref:NUDIX hydrolase family protein n=2 Tax=Flavobacterium branchiophilum TaxID=55197 RepID=G2Z6I3_FLABF|nr:NUDIX domain-containing protein [Flavobacterium branchiophilum]PDS27041.1 NUDIX hydrolase [Flavobacterium branchiophilum]CCB71015.1 NUDIX hydrolase family protein [Flavobacterium branchiophilum FL-15]